MSKLKTLESEAEKEGIDVQETKLPANVSGLYYNNGMDGPLIAISKYLRTRCEQACVLAEELGHHHTSCGNLLTDSTIDNTIVRQQEIRAKRWAYKRMIPLTDLIRAYEAGCQSLYEFAEHLEVTEDFLRRALKQYAAIYGINKRCGNYIIYFDPPAILRLFETEGSDNSDGEKARKE